MSNDKVLDQLKYLGMANAPADKVKIIFLPCYLDGNDGILNFSYYDIILGNDLTIYPSYYEPWGYTPLESIRFPRTDHYDRSGRFRVVGKLLEDRWQL